MAQNINTYIQTFQLFISLRKLHLSQFPTNTSILYYCRVRGLINDIKFNKNSIMLYSQPQDITGRKTLIASKDNPVRFKSIQVEKLLNNIDIKSFIRNVVKFTSFHYRH